ncbi:MAG: rod shape-determining protein MreC [Dehalococcoidia bacterium]|nr:rod shape-determining protein MreC [Dehalococcoidia bacterium]
MVSRDASSFTDVVHINKGSGAGLEPGMVVLSTEGSLVGTVTDVLPTRASVRLISDSRSAVNARVLGTDIDGSVRGSATKTVHLELARGNINEGDEIVTSGVGANYPPGLPIGMVSNVQGTPQDMFLQVTIDPHVRLATLRTVLVNTSFDPSREQLENVWAGR